MKKKRAYILLTRIPEAGFCKSRLSPAYSAEESAFLQALMLQRLLQEMISLTAEATLFLCYTGVNTTAKSHFLKQIPLGFQTFVQTGDDLGARMAAAFAHVQALGFEQIILTGSDLPQLTANDIQQAFQQLEDHKVVLGPTFDGGYYLIGTDNCSPEFLFQPTKKWGGTTVFEETCLQLREKNIAFQLLAPQFDIDVQEDIVAANVPFLKIKTGKGLTK